MIYKDIYFEGINFLIILHIDDEKLREEMKDLINDDEEEEKDNSDSDDEVGRKKKRRHGKNEFINKVYCQFVK